MTAAAPYTQTNTPQFTDQDRVVLNDAASMAFGASRQPTGLELVALLTPYHPGMSAAELLTAAQ